MVILVFREACGESLDGYITFTQVASHSGQSKLFILSSLFFVENSFHRLYTLKSKTNKTGLPRKEATETEETVVLHATVANKYLV